MRSVVSCSVGQKCLRKMGDHYIGPAPPFAPYLPTFYPIYPLFASNTMTDWPIVIISSFLILTLILRTKPRCSILILFKWLSRFDREDAARGASLAEPDNWFSFKLQIWWLKSIKSGREVGESKLKAIIRCSANPGEPTNTFQSTNFNLKSKFTWSLHGFQKLPSNIYFRWSNNSIKGIGIIYQDTTMTSTSI